MCVSVGGGGAGERREKGRGGAWFFSLAAVSLSLLSLPLSSLLTLLGAGGDEGVLHPGRRVKVLGGRVRQGGGQGEVVKLLGRVGAATAGGRGGGERGRARGLDGRERGGGGIAAAALGSPRSLALVLARSHRLPLLPSPPHPRFRPHPNGALSPTATLGDRPAQWGGWPGGGAGAKGAGRPVRPGGDPRPPHADRDETASGKARQQPPPAAPHPHPHCGQLPTRSPRRRLTVRPGVGARRAGGRGGRARGRKGRGVADANSLEKNRSDPKPGEAIPRPGFSLSLPPAPTLTGRRSWRRPRC